MQHQASSLTPRVIQVFTDGSSNVTATITIEHKKRILQTSEKSAHKAEIIAVIEVFKTVSQSFIFRLYVTSFSCY